MKKQHSLELRSGRFQLLTGVGQGCFYQELSGQGVTLNSQIRERQ
jgi:hypothetical protein